MGGHFRRTKPIAHNLFNTQSTARPTTTTEVESQDLSTVTISTIEGETIISSSADTELNAGKLHVDTGSHTVAVSLAATAPHTDTAPHADTELHADTMSHDDTASHADVVVKTVLVDCFRIEGVPRLMRVFFAAGNFVSVAGTSTVILVILAPPSEVASTLAVVSTITLVSTVDSTSEFDKIVVVFSPVDLIRFWAL